MQLHYNILWIDNDLPGYIERGQVKRIEEFLLELGFEPNVVTLLDDSELDTRLNETKFDLIISDYQLDTTTGDKIIEHIRERKVMTEILFYSAKTNFREDPEIKENLKLVDRISFHYGRETLLDRIENLVELTLDKLLELNATRGIITSATSELDVMIEELTIYLVREKLSKSEEDLTGIIDFYISDFLEKSPSSFRKRYQKIGFNNMFSSIESNRKWSIFRNLLREYMQVDSSETIKSFCIVNKLYFKEVIDIRNKFAHAKAENIEGRVILKGQYGKEGFEYDKDSCITVRKNLIKHRKNFEKLRKHFGI